MTKDIKTELSLEQRYEDIMSDVQKEIMEEEISELHSIKENDINIATIYVFDNGDYLEAKVYFRNGLDRDINFEFVPLILLNSNNEEVARDTFNLKELGNIPSGGARPWKIHFNRELVKMDKFKDQKCSVVFASRVKAVNYANIEYDGIPEVFQKHKLVFEKFLYDLPGIEKGKLSISTFDIVLNVDGKIIVTLVIRNSLNKDVKLEEIPITIKDSKDKVVTSTKFSLGDFIVKSMKAKICNLAVQTDMKVDYAVSFKDKFNVIFQ